MNDDTRAEVDLHDALVGRLQYFDGHSDTIGLFPDAGFLERAAAAVADPFRDVRVQKVAGIEARGFILARRVRKLVRGSPERPAR